jgi:hypothetical protein
LQSSFVPFPIGSLERLVPGDIGWLHQLGKASRNTGHAGFHLSHRLFHFRCNVTPITVPD